ncbi:MAG TPA: hypothetical protein VNE42_10015 [Acidimicrobiales bacterium]|nr:hypothetical protein [Acidimicrobiales bacterium]
MKEYADLRLNAPFVVGLSPTLPQQAMPLIGGRQGNGASAGQQAYLRANQAMR